MLWQRASFFGHHRSPAVGSSQRFVWSSPRNGRTKKGSSHGTTMLTRCLSNLTNPSRRVTQCHRWRSWPKLLKRFGKIDSSTVAHEDMCHMVSNTMFLQNPAGVSRKALFRHIRPAPTLAYLSATWWNRQQKINSIVFYSMFLCNSLLVICTTLRYDKFTTHRVLKVGDRKSSMLRGFFS